MSGREVREEERTSVAVHGDERGRIAGLGWRRLEGLCAGEGLGLRGGTARRRVLRGRARTAGLSAEERGIATRCVRVLPHSHLACLSLG